MIFLKDSKVFVTPDEWGLIENIMRNCYTTTLSSPYGERVIWIYQNKEYVGFYSSLYPVEIESMLNSYQVIKINRVIASGSVYELFA